jgi:hypothetical protein
MTSRVIRRPYAATRRAEQTNRTPYSRPEPRGRTTSNFDAFDSGNAASSSNAVNGRIGVDETAQTAEHRAVSRGINQLQSEMNQVRISTVPDELGHAIDQQNQLNQLGSLPPLPGGNHADGGGDDDDNHSVEAVARAARLADSGLDLQPSMATAVKTLKLVRKRAHDKFCLKCRLKPRKDANPNNPINRLCDFVETEYRADNEVDFVETVFAYTYALWYSKPKLKAILPEWTVESLLYCARRTSPLERHKRILMEMEELYVDTMRLVDSGSQREFPNDRQLGGLLRVMQFQQQMYQRERGRK